MIPLKLFFYRILFGKFSFTFQDNFRNGRLTSANSRKKYLRSCSRNDLLSHYHKIIEKKQKVTEFKSNEDFQFDQVDFGISFSKFRRRKSGFKCYDVQRYLGYIWKRIGYKERLLNYGVKRIYHFLDNKFFFGELLFSDIRRLDHKKIASALIMKYTGSDNFYNDGDFRINFNNGFIYFENSGIHVSIKYITTDFQEVNDKLRIILNEGPVVIQDTIEQTFDVL